MLGRLGRHARRVRGRAWAFSTKVEDVENVEFSDGDFEEPDREEVERLTSQFAEEAFESAFEKNKSDDPMAQHVQQENVEADEVFLEEQPQKMQPYKVADVSRRLDKFVLDAKKKEQQAKASAKENPVPKKPATVQNAEVPDSTPKTSVTDDADSVDALEMEEEDEDVAQLNLLQKWAKSRLRMKQMHDEALKQEADPMDEVVFLMTEAPDIVRNDFVERVQKIRKMAEISMRRSGSFDPYFEDDEDERVYRLVRDLHVTPFQAYEGHKWIKDLMGDLPDNVLEHVFDNSAVTPDTVTFLGDALGMARRPLEPIDVEKARKAEKDRLTPNIPIGFGAMLMKHHSTINMYELEEMFLDKKREEFDKLDFFDFQFNDITEDKELLDRMADSSSAYIRQLHKLVDANIATIGGEEDDESMDHRTVDAARDSGRDPQEFDVRDRVADNRDGRSSEELNEYAALDRNTENTRVVEENLAEGEDVDLDAMNAKAKDEMMQGRLQSQEKHSSTEDSHIQFLRRHPRDIPVNPEARPPKPPAMRNMFVDPDAFVYGFPHYDNRPYMMDSVASTTGMVQVESTQQVLGRIATESRKVLRGEEVAKIEVAIDDIDLVGAEMDRFLDIVGSRYNENKRTVRFTCRDFPTYRENEAETLRMLRGSIKGARSLVQTFPQGEDHY